MNTLVCIPTYDERENLDGIVARTLSAVPGAHVLVVDDDSPDGTGAAADALALADRRVHVLHRTAKQGLGAAYCAAFSWGIRHGYDVLVEMDADGSHRPEQLPGMLDLIGDADLVIGSRWVPGGETVGWPLSRRVLSRGGSLWARLALGLHQRDTTSGFRAYTAEALRLITPQSVRSEGYAFQIEMLWRAEAEGLRVVETPITFADRTRGTSKMSGRIVVEAMVRVTAWGLGGARRRRRRAPRVRAAA